MSVYYTILNVNKMHEVCPSTFDEGVKMCDDWPGPRTREFIHNLYVRGTWHKDDEIRVISDAGGSYHHVRGNKTDTVVQEEDPRIVVIHPRTLLGFYYYESEEIDFEVFPPGFHNHER